MKMMKFFCIAALAASALCASAADEAPAAPAPGEGRRPAMDREFTPSPYARLFFTVMRTKPELMKQAADTLTIYKAGKLSESEETKKLLTAEAAARLTAIITEAAKSEEILAAAPEEYKSKFSDPAKLAEEIIANAEKYSEDPFLSNFCFSCAPRMMQGGPGRRGPGWNGQGGPGRPGGRPMPRRNRRNNGAE